MYEYIDIHGNKIDMITTVKYVCNHAYYFS